MEPVAIYPHLHVLLHLQVEAALHVGACSFAAVATASGARFSRFRARPSNGFG